MNKLVIVLTIFFLIIITTITKNSTKKLENKIFIINENISVLKNKYELFLLDYNVLSTPQKLMEYQQKFFESDLTTIDINEIKKISIHKEELVILEFNKKNNENE